MNLSQGILLGFIQGLTEFLPVSSSGHLVLTQRLMGIQGSQLSFDVAVHVGTLIAVVIALRREVGAILSAFVGRGSTRGGWPSRRAAALGPHPVSGWRLFWLMIVGTLPAAFVGLAWRDQIESAFSQALIPGLMLLLTALLLWLADRRRAPLPGGGWRGRPGPPPKGLERITTWDAVVVGLGQALAILPGLSRSGTTISAGVWRGIDQEAAARYSFLLSIPVILGAAALELPDAMALGATDWSVVGAGMIAAAVTGYAAVAWFLRFLQRGRLWPFALYTGTIGLAAVFLAWSGRL